MTDKEVVDEAVKKVMDKKLHNTFLAKIAWNLRLLFGTYSSFVAVYWIAQVFKEPTRWLINLF